MARRFSCNRIWSVKRSFDCKEQRAFQSPSISGSEVKGNKLQYSNNPLGIYIYKKREESEIFLKRKIRNFVLPDAGWNIIMPSGVPAKRSVYNYSCCPEPYVDVTFTLHIRRRSLYYWCNVILPSLLIASMTLLSFTLTSESGSKLTLGTSHPSVHYQSQNRR